MQQVLLCWMDSISKYVYGAFRRMINSAIQLAAFRRRVLSIELPFSYQRAECSYYREFCFEALDDRDWRCRRHRYMIGSILDKLDRLGDQHPHKLLYSYIDLNGNPIESYSYESFLHRTKVIAGHLRKEHRFASQDRLLLAYPPGLEMICAFFGCVRAGLIPVPVYPPSSHGFQGALYKMVHIAKDCQAAGILTSKDYHGSLKTNLASSGVAASGVDVDYISGLQWIVTEDFVDMISDETFNGSSGNGSSDNGLSKILFLQYTSGSTRDPKGVMVTHENILHNCPLVIDHPEPVVVSWLPQYHDMGLIGCYLYPALQGGTTYGFAPTDFIQRPALWFDAIKTYRATASAAPNFAYDYCLRAGRLSKESLENCDLSSLRSPDGCRGTR